jgi:hypothetical protein
MLKSQTYDKLKVIIDQIDKSVICQSVANNGDGTYTFACNYTKWLTAGYDITIGLGTYTIVSFVCNESITVSGVSLPTVLTFDLYPLIFKHGTIKKASTELDSMTDFKGKVPLVFLHEISEEKIHLDPIDAIDNDVDVNMYFLTDCDFANWNQLQGDTLGIQPMRNAVNEFIKCLSVSQYVADLTGIGTVKNQNVFGNMDANGTIKNIFNMPLTGVKLKIGIPFLKDCECCENGTLDNRPAPGYVYDQLGSLLAVLYSNMTYTTGTPCAGVTIIDQYGNILTTVISGGNYNVEVLEEIEDTIDNNTTTIIDPII